ncbi:hypothetical protein CGZ96_08570 [Enemella evansiae]|nr:hypothetical protein CGZ96_08570 [Enemella evansiae]
MGLVEESRPGGDLGGRNLVEQQCAGQIQAPPDEIPVWRDPVRRGERADEMRNAHPECVGRLRQAGVRQRIRVETFPDQSGQPRGRSRGGVAVLRAAGEVPAEPLDDQCQALGRLQVIVPTQGPVDPAHLIPQGRILDQRGIDQPADPGRVELVLLQIEHSFGETPIGERVAVMRDVRWQHGDPGTRWGQRVPAVDVVTDRTGIDDQHRPGRVGVRGIGVRPPAGMQHLGHARDLRAESQHRIRRPATHDSHSPMAVDGVNGSFGPATLAGVKEYQRRQKIAVDGSVGPETWAKLLPELRYGQRGGTVSVVQLTLRDSGAQLAVDGSFGPDTRVKLKAFQQANRLPASGKVDAATWRALMNARAAQSAPAPVRAPAPKASQASGQREIVLVNQLETGPNSKNNCGPTSAVMALIADGKQPAGYQRNPSDATKRSMVVTMQQRMGIRTGNGVSVEGMRRGLSASGASTTQTNTDQALAAVRSGRPVLLNGHTRNLEWMNSTRGVGHWIVVVEHKGGDNYVALDPWGGKRFDTTGAAMKKFTNTYVDKDRSQNALVIR